MQSGQVSLWVPLVAAVLAGILGISGVVAGQLINARRERRIEDLRWEREREREEREWRRQTCQRELEIRTSAYRTILLVVDRWADELFAWGGSLMYDRMRPPDLAALPGLENEARSALVEVRIHGSERVEDLAITAIGELKDLQCELEDLTKEKENNEGAEMGEVPESAAIIALRELARAIRSETSMSSD